MILLMKINPFNSKVILNLNKNNTYKGFVSSCCPGAAVMRAGTVPAPPYPYLPGSTDIFDKGIFNKFFSPFLRQYFSQIDLA